MNDVKPTLDQWQIELCRDIAFRAHEGQTRWGGIPYITHPERVAADLQDDPVACCVAWLHDVIEDTDWTAEMLAEAGVAREIIRLVEVLTHTEDEPYLDYVLRVKAEPICRKVKVCDIVDNITDTPNAEQIDKYRAALLLLVE